MKLAGNCKPMGIGSVPDTDPINAWKGILYNFPDIPFWPQLPKRSYLENMYLQFSEGLPGRVVDIENKRFFIDKNKKLQAEMETFYNKYMANDLEIFRISRRYSEGIHSGIDLFNDDNKAIRNAKFIKGQITGPISFGLQVVDESLKPILYDEMLYDIVIKNLERKARWQEKILSTINEKTIISVDEPYLSSIGSGLLNLDRSRVIEDINKVFQGVNNIKATHCCGNTDWSMLVETSTDILLFDAFNYVQNLALFSSEIQEFIDRGGCIGWGIVPTTSNDLENKGFDYLIKRLEDGLDMLTGKGLDREVILHHSYITPSCGLGTLSIPQAELAMKYTRMISEHMQKKYELDSD